MPISSPCWKTGLCLYSTKWLVVARLVTAMPASFLYKMLSLVCFSLSVNICLSHPCPCQSFSHPWDRFNLGLLVRLISASFNTKRCFYWKWTPLEWSSGSWKEGRRQKPRLLSWTSRGHTSACSGIYLIWSWKGNKSRRAVLFLIDWIFLYLTRNSLSTGSRMAHSGVQENLQGWQKALHGCARRAWLNSTMKRKHARGRHKHRWLRRNRATV